jgi:DNA-binding transcriptional LysR family regulator
MNLRHIEALHAVLQTGSVMQAAGLLGVSQPAVSKLIRHAEQRIGFQLFERVKGRLIPTQELRMLESELGSLFGQLEHFRRLARNVVARSEGRLRLGSSHSLGLSVVPHVIARFQTSFPNISYDIRTQHTAELIEGLRAQELDLALTFDPEPNVGIRSVRIGSAELVYVTRDIHRREVSLGEIPTTALIGLMEGDPIGSLLDRKLRDANIALRPSIRVQTYYIACALVANGCGNAIVDQFTADAMRHQGVDVVRIRPRIAFKVAALSNDLAVLPKFCSEFVKAARNTISRWHLD